MRSYSHRSHRNRTEGSAVYSLLLASATKDARLFPKLRSLAWSESRLASILALRLLLPTIETISLNVSNTRFTKAIVPDLRTAPRASKLLSLWARSGLTELSLKCCAISNRSLGVIAGWPHLKWLTFRLGFNNQSIYPHLISFLRTFRMLLVDSGPRSFKYPNIKTLLVKGELCSLASIWSELVSLLTHTKLEHMTLAEPDTYSLRPGHPPIFFELRPLLAHPTALTDIRTLVISTRRSMSIPLTDADILALARTCPHLNIPTKGCATPPYPYARLDALAVASLNIDDQVSLQPNIRLVGLCVGESPISCVGPLRPPTAPDPMWSIPRFLYTMAPQLVGVTTAKATVEGMKARWEMVSNTLLAMAKGG
ncbi:hypothetical protein EDB19DRAFT_1912482 [Suillus lakei]|nr:hypothetical protein EDB19DRAFT_1912482 [Suillus lakei]